MQHRSQSSQNRPFEGRTSAATLAGLSNTFLATLTYRFNREVARSRFSLKTYILHVEPARDTSSSGPGSALSKHHNMSPDLARLLLQAHECFECRDHYTQARVDD